jgi:hypothetical protein
VSKTLVDTRTNLIRGTYVESPLNFSIAGRYVIDVPDALGIKPITNSVTDLVNAKIAAFLAAQGMVGSFNDEFLASPNVDATKSSRFGIGPNKRTVILGGGWITTNIITIPASFTQIFAHWNAYLYTSVPSGSLTQPPPPQILYNWDFNSGEFIDFDPNNFIVEMRDTADSVTLATLSPDVKTPMAGGPGFQFRLRITNNDFNHIWTTSDWVLLYQ